MMNEQEKLQSEKDLEKKELEKNEKLDMSEMEELEGGMGGNGCSAPLSGGCSGNQSIKENDKL